MTAPGDDLAQWLRAEYKRLDERDGLTTDEASRCDFIAYGLADEDRFVAFLSEVRADGVARGMNRAAEIALLEGGKAVWADRCDPAPRDIASAIRAEAKRLRAGK